jgi:hypothetical protein
MRGFGTQVSKFLFERTSREFIRRLFYLLQEMKDSIDASFLKDLAQIIQWKKEPIGEQILTESNIVNLRLIAMAAANGGIPFSRFRNILDAVRANVSMSVQAAIILCINMYYVLQENVTERKSARGYVGNLNCRFLKRSLDQIGIMKFVDDLHRMKPAVAAGAGVAADVLAFVNTVTCVNKDGAAYLQFEPREILLALNKCRTRIEKLVFTQDLLPTNPRIFLNVPVTEFVERWIDPDKRKLFRSILSQQLGELRK